jgi:acetyltransferase-like isoleucine patch superfamily enzyme
MISFQQIIRNFLKKNYINGYKDIFLHDSTRIGKYSQLIVTKQSNRDSSIAKIDLHKSVGIGRYNELQVWDNNQIIIKSYSSLNDNCKILGDVTIEKYCTFSANIYASSGNHYATAKPTWLIKDQDIFVLSTEQGRKEHSEKIHFEEDCWIGFGVFIKRGTYIGRGAIIGANTVVTKDVDPYSVHVGNPNKEIKKRLDFTPPLEIHFSNEGHLPYFYRGFSQRRNELEKSRKDNVIIADEESIITLAHSNNLQELNINGKNLVHPVLLNLSISLNGKHNWKIQINSEAINLKLAIADALSIEDDNLYGSLGDGLKQYSIISISSQTTASAKCHFGITNILLK